MSLNLGYIFYRKIKNTNIDFGRSIKEVCKNIKVDSKEYFAIKDSIKLTFTTCYPGLTIGLGYDHDSSENDDFKLGFMFDYTTGLPYIPGSSLKGTIRSLFPANKDDTQKLSFINSILNKEYSYQELYEIEKSIFGKKTDDKKSLDNPDTKDIFYDGYFETKKGDFLVDDYITPHKEEIKSPEPLKFLKISPGTKVTLQIKLAENDKISKQDRLKLYKEILEWTGIGAKTNVGYGAIDIRIEENLQKLKRDNIKIVTETGSNIDKAKAFIDNSNKPTRSLFKNLNNIDLNDCKNEVLSYFENKFSEKKGKWNDKILKLLT